MLNTKTQRDKNFALSRFRASVLLALCLLVILPSFGKGKPAAVSQKQETTILAEEKRKFDYYFLEALRQKMQGNRDDAADNLLRCYYIDPENAAVFSELANLNISIGRTALAKSGQAGTRKFLDKTGAGSTLPSKPGIQTGGGSK